jgi:hypothetical protein
MRSMLRLTVKTSVNFQEPRDVKSLFGLALRKTVQVTSKPNNRDDDAETQGGLPNPPSVAAAP